MVISDVFSDALVTQMSLKCEFLQLWTGQMNLLIKSLKLEAWTLKTNLNVHILTAKQAKS